MRNENKIFISHIRYFDTQPYTVHEVYKLCTDKVTTYEVLVVFRHILIKLVFINRKIKIIVTPTTKKSASFIYTYKLVHIRNCCRRQL